MDADVSKTVFFMEGISRGFLIVVGGFGLLSSLFFAPISSMVWLMFISYLLVAVLAHYNHILFVSLSIIGISLSLFFIYISVTKIEIFTYSKIILMISVLMNLSLIFLKTINKKSRE
jgi:hypothetical protein